MLEVHLLLQTLHFLIEFLIVATNGLFFCFFLQLKTNVVLVVRGKNLRGFLLDGFPATPGQAAEFEKFLTGYDYMFWKRFRAAGSKLAPPPKPV